MIGMSFVGTSVIATSPALQGCVHRTHRNGGGKRIDIRWKLYCGNVWALGSQLAKRFNMTLSVSVGASDFLAALVIMHCSTQKSSFLIRSWIRERPNHNRGCFWVYFDLLCVVSCPCVTDFEVYRWYSLSIGRTRIIRFSKDASILYYFQVSRQSDVGN